MNKKGEAHVGTTIGLSSIITGSLLSYLFPIIPAVLGGTASYIFSMKSNNKKFNFGEYGVFLFFSYVAGILSYLFFIDDYTNGIISNSKLGLYVLLSCIGGEYVIRNILIKFKKSKIIPK